MMKNIIDFFIAVGFLFPQFLGFAIGLLQLLQPRPYTTNTSFIKSFIGKLSSKGTSEMPELWQNVGSANKNLMLGREAQKRSVETWN